jgi:hypothetical protein
MVLTASEAGLEHTGCYHPTQDLSDGLKCRLLYRGYIHIHIWVLLFLRHLQEQRNLSSKKKSLSIGWESSSLILFQELIFTPSLSAHLFLFPLRRVNVFYKYQISFI